MKINLDGEQTINGVMNIGAEGVNSRRRNTKAVDVSITFDGLVVSGKATITIDYSEWKSL